VRRPALKSTSDPSDTIQLTQSRESFREQRLNHYKAH